MTVPSAYFKRVANFFDRIALDLEQNEDTSHFRTYHFQSFSDDIGAIVLEVKLVGILADLIRLGEDTFLVVVIEGVFLFLAAQDVLELIRRKSGRSTL